MLDNDHLIIVRLMAPLVCLMRIIDCDERPSIGYVHEDMYRARLGIKKLLNYNKSILALYKYHKATLRWTTSQKYSCSSSLVESIFPI